MGINEIGTITLRYNEEDRQELLNRLEDFLNDNGIQVSDIDYNDDNNEIIVETKDDFVKTFTMTNFRHGEVDLV